MNLHIIRIAHYQTQVNKYIKVGYVNIYISYH